MERILISREFGKVALASVHSYKFRPHSVHLLSISLDMRSKSLSRRSIRFPVVRDEPLTGRAPSALANAQRLAFQQKQEKQRSYSIDVSIKVSQKRRPCVSATRKMVQLFDRHYHREAISETVRQ